MQSVHTVSCAGPPSFGRGSPKVLAHQLPCKLSSCVEMLLNPFVVTTVVVVATSHSHRLVPLHYRLASSHIGSFWPEIVQIQKEGKVIITGRQSLSPGWDYVCVAHFSRGFHDKSGKQISCTNFVPLKLPGFPVSSSHSWRRCLSCYTLLVLYYSFGRVSA